MQPEGLESEASKGVFLPFRRLFLLGDDLMSAEPFNRRLTAVPGEDGKTSNGSSGGSAMRRLDPFPSGSFSYGFLTRSERPYYGTGTSRVFPVRSRADG